MGNQAKKEAAGEVNCKPGWKRIVVLNGAARTGKDTFIDLIKAAVDRRNLHLVVRSRSSIDPVRNMLQDVGIDLSMKTEEDRRLLATVGTAMEEHSGFRSNYIIDGLKNWMDASYGRLMFVHIRELDVIERVRHKAAELGWPMTTMLLLRAGYDPIMSNPADAMVHAMSYDLHVKNNGDLTELATLADMYLTLILSIDQSV